MLRKPICCLVVASLTLLSLTAVARAQNTTCTGSGTVSPSTSWSLAIKSDPQSWGFSDSDFITLAPTAIEYLLDIAECQCDAGDLYLRALVTAGITANIPPQFSVWFGNSCFSPVNRPETCEQATDAVSINTFLRGSSAGKPAQPISVPALVAPMAAAGNTWAHQCIQGAVSNSVWFLFGDPNAPEYCNIELDYYGTPPIAPAALSASSEDQSGRSVTLSWQGPAQGSVNLPDSYQVLCSDESFGPLSWAGAYAFGEKSVEYFFRLGYSSCLDPAAHRIQRRVLATRAPVQSSDMGFVVGNPTPGSLEEQGAPLEPETDPADGGACADPASAPEAWKRFDRSFVCSEPLASTTTQARVQHLLPGHCYHFQVVGIDRYGNPSPSSTVTFTTITPPPVEPVAAGCSCDVSGRAPSTSGAAVMMFIVGLAFARRRAPWQSQKSSPAISL